MATVRANLAAGRINDLVKEIGFDWSKVAEIIDQALDEQRQVSLDLRAEQLRLAGQAVNWLHAIAPLHKRAPEIRRLADDLFAEIEKSRST